MSVTHAAGPVVGIKGRIIQRCPVCGEKLCDSLNTAMPLNPDGSIPEFPTWAEGALVEIDGNRSSLVGEFLTMELPVNFCLVLVER